MNEKTVEVSGLSFTQIDIFGCYLPTITSIESVLAKIPDKRNKRKICERSNKLTMLCSQRFDIPDSYFDDYVCKVLFRVEKTNEDSIYNLEKIETMITAAQCELAGLNVKPCLQTMFIRAWFEGMVGSHSFDLQTMRKMLVNTLECVHNRSKPIEKYVDVKLKPLTSREQEYPEYVVARLMFELICNRICSIAKYDKRMCFLIHEDYQIICESFQRLEDIKDKTCINVCTKCNVHFKSKKHPSIKICNSCKNKSAEQKKANRRIDRKGWMFDRVGVCNGGCGSPRIKINTSGSCLSCYRPSL